MPLSFLSLPPRQPAWILNSVACLSLRIEPWRMVRAFVTQVFLLLKYVQAGMPLTQVTGSDAGVFVGCFTREYEAITFKDPELNLRYSATGTGTTMLANRLSYFYDLRGPSVTLDTACSSSLTACHLACSALRQRECSSVSFAHGSLQN